MLLVGVRLVSFWQAWHVPLRNGEARWGSAGVAGLGSMWHGRAGMVCSGTEWQCTVRQATVRLGRLGKLRFCEAG